MKEPPPNRDQRPGLEWPDLLARGLKGIREPAQRFSKIIETLRSKDSAEVAEFLTRGLAAEKTGGEAAQATPCQETLRAQNY